MKGSGGRRMSVADFQAELGGQNLDRNLARVLLVLGEKDNRHSPTAEFAIDRVAVGEGSSQAGQRVMQERLRLCGAGS
jgi:hypothetical protein